MYYLITEYELPMLAYGTKRKLVTIGNKKGFADMYDHMPPAIPATKIMPKDILKDFMKDGFATMKEAENADKLKEEIKDFIGFPFANIVFKVMSEEGLLRKYASL